MEEVELDTESTTEASATDLLEDVKKILDGQAQQIEGLESVLQKREEIITSQKDTINQLLSEVTKIRNGLRIERKLRAAAEKKQGQMSTELEEVKGQLKKEKEGRLQTVRKLSQLGHLNFMGMKIAYEGNCLATSEEHGYAIRRKEMMDLVKLVCPSPASSTSGGGSVSDHGTAVPSNSTIEGHPNPETITLGEPETAGPAPVIPPVAPPKPRVVVLNPAVENGEGTTSNPAPTMSTGRHLRTVRFSGGRATRKQKRAEARKKFGKGFRHPPSTGQGHGGGRRSRDQDNNHNHAEYEGGGGQYLDLEYNDMDGQAQEYDPASHYYNNPGFSYCYSPWGFPM